MTVTETILCELDRWHLEPQDINRGECVSFAQNIARKADVQLVGDSRLLFGDESLEQETFEMKGCGHIWVTDGDKHYDAECPEGVAEWRDLPFYD